MRMRDEGKKKEGERGGQLSSERSPCDLTNRRESTSTTKG